MIIKYICKNLRTCFTPYRGVSQISRWTVYNYMDDKSEKLIEHAICHN